MVFLVLSFFGGGGGNGKNLHAIQYIPCNFFF